MRDRELGDDAPLLLAAILLIVILAMAGCAHAPPPPVIDVEAPNIFERCKAKCAEHRKVPLAACETADRFKCFCEPEPT